MREGNDIPRAFMISRFSRLRLPRFEIQERFDGVLFPMLFVGHFEGLTVHRAIAHACDTGGVKHRTRLMQQSEPRRPTPQTGRSFSGSVSILGQSPAPSLETR